MSRNGGLRELYYRQQGLYPANYQLSNQGEGSYRGSETSSRLPRTPLFMDKQSSRLRHLTQLQGSDRQKDTYSYPPADSIVSGVTGEDFCNPNNPHNHNNTHLHEAQDAETIESTHQLTYKYGFNLPTSERLRTSNAQIGNLTERGQILTRNYSSNGEALAVSAGLIVRGFTEKTTSHGIPHIYFASGMLKKVIWTIVSLAAFVALCLHLYLLISSWGEFAISTRQTSQPERRLVFPAVSICNYNTLRLSTINNQLRLSTIIEESSSMSNGTAQRAQLRYQLIHELAKEYTLLSDEEFFSLGHNASELALFCSFHGETCGQQYFTYFRDPRYGNCITFNSGRSPVGITNSTARVPLKTSSFTGPQSGLSLVVFVEQFDYIPMLTEAVGARIVIHNQTVMPFPEQNAISLTVNNLVNIGIRKTVHERLSGRYGNCTAHDDNTNNIYHDTYKVDYSQTACLSTCLQREVTRRCNCHLATVPFDRNSAVFENIAPLSVCNDSIPSVENCLTQVQDEYEDGTIPCTYCYSACTELEFTSSFSSAMWPADSYLDDFIDDLNSNYPDIMRRIRARATQPEMGEPNPTADEIRENVRELVKSNFLLVNIYYEQLQVMKYQEIVLYDDYQFASDLGGSFGLWVGWSIITMVEFMEIALDLLVYFCYGCIGSRRTNPRK